MAILSNIVEEYRKPISHAQWDLAGTTAITLVEGVAGSRIKVISLVISLTLAIADDELSLQSGTNVLHVFSLTGGTTLFERATGIEPLFVTESGEALTITPGDAASVGSVYIQYVVE